MSKKFQRTIEDFECINCGAYVKGDGYTDHCPACLWSRHVDNNPGDRQNQCRGMLEPIGIEKIRGQDKLVYRCQKCNLVSRVRFDKKDNLIQIEKIIKEKNII